MTEATKNVGFNNAFFPFSTELFHFFPFYEFKSSVSTKVQLDIFQFNYYFYYFPVGQTRSNFLGQRHALHLRAYEIQIYIFTVEWVILGENSRNYVLNFWKDQELEKVMCPVHPF